MMDKKKFGTILKHARKQSGYTQSDLAHLLGVTKACICNYEKGTSSPNIERFCKLSTLLSIGLLDVEECIK